MFDLAAGALGHLGYTTWLGRFCDDRSSTGVGLERYQGGMEGGPLVLFDSSDPGSQALVLSPSDNFFSAMMGVRSGYSPSCALSQGHTSSSLALEPSHECALGSCQLEANVDYEGHDLYSVNNVVSPSACCALCAQEPGCGFFSLVETTCYLKVSDAGRSPNPGHVSGRVPGRQLVFGVQGRVKQVSR